jgi:hypothetical protein
MASTFYLKKGDTYPNIETILADGNGPVNLTGCTVLFRMSVANTGNLMIEKAATIVTPQSGGDVGKCYAEFEAGDTDELGEYRVEWVVTFPNTKSATFPRGEGDIFNKVIIQQIVD